MNAHEPATETQPAEFFARVNGVEYCVEVRRDTWRDEPICWVTVKRFQPEVHYWASIISEHTRTCSSDLDAMREGFRHQRYRMRNWLESWLTYRYSAAAEHGGKRGYYTRLANDAHKQAMTYAPNWKLCKAIWKEVTKL
jgi:hypothetical protein